MYILILILALLLILILILMLILINICIPTYIEIWNVCIHMQAHMCMYICTPMYACVHIYIYICMSTCVYMYNLYNTLSLPLSLSLGGLSLTYSLQTRRSIVELGLGRYRVHQQQPAALN